MARICQMATPITPEMRRQLAQQHGVNEQYLYQCLTGRRDMKPEMAMRLEEDSGGVLLRQMLCQTTYAAIWKDLPQLPSAELEPSKEVV